MVARGGDLLQTSLGVVVLTLPVLAPLILRLDRRQGVVLEEDAASLEIAEVASIQVLRLDLDACLRIDQPLLRSLLDVALAQMLELRVL